MLLEKNVLSTVRLIFSLLVPAFDHLLVHRPIRNLSLRQPVSMLTQSVAETRQGIISCDINKKIITKARNDRLTNQAAANIETL